MAGSCAHQSGLRRNLGLARVGPGSTRQEFLDHLRLMAISREVLKLVLWDSWSDEVKHAGTHGDLLIPTHVPTDTLRW